MVQQVSDGPSRGRQRKRRPLPVATSNLTQRQYRQKASLSNGNARSAEHATHVLRSTSPARSFSVPRQEVDDGLDQEKGPSGGRQLLYFSHGRVPVNGP